MKDTTNSGHVQGECDASEGSTDADADLTACNEIPNSTMLDEIADLLRFALEDEQVRREDIHKVLQKEGGEMGWRETLKSVQSAATPAFQNTSENGSLLKRTWHCPFCGEMQKTADIHKRLRTKASLTQDDLPLCEDATLKCSVCGY
ncbi:unnamed protein product [Phytomonas sp. Hart1]|nr:unnamed protein product [Phytomonas sp. Hart1]|eukprot:CCW70381.1 unnamed protein product [Phytomonas sp. isolate Hart1]